MTYPKLAALAVVIRSMEVQLVRRKNEPDTSLWDFTGGCVGLGERVDDAACRELLEETTGLAEPSRTLTGLDTIFPDTQDGTEFHYYLVAVQCAYVFGEPLPRDNVDDARWVEHIHVFERRIPLNEDVDSVFGLALRHQFAESPA